MIFTLFILFLQSSPSSAQSSVSSYPIEDINKEGVLQGIQRSFDEKFSVFGGTIAGRTQITNGNFSVGGSTLVITGGNVGIGTASPTQVLHVVGNSTFTANVAVSGTLYTVPNSSKTLLDVTTCGSNGGNSATAVLSSTITLTVQNSNAVVAVCATVNYRTTGTSDDYRVLFVEDGAVSSDGETFVTLTQTRENFSGCWHRTGVASGNHSYSLKCRNGNSNGAFTFPDQGGGFAREFIAYEIK